jgi:hypothetical protein
MHLESDESEAKKKRHALLAETRPAPDDSVYRILNRHLTWCKLHVAESTFKCRRTHLMRFAKFIGRIRKVSELKPFHAQGFLDDGYSE